MREKFSEAYEVKLGVLKDYLSCRLPPNSSIVFLQEVDHSLLSSIDETELAALQNIVRNAEYLLCVTHCRVKNPEHAMIPGFARVLRMEYPSLKLHTLDIASPNSNGNITANAAAEEAAVLISRVFFATITEKIGGGHDFERAVKDDGVIYIERMVPDEALNSSFSDKDFHEVESIPFQSKKALKIAIEKVGQLDTVYFTEDSRVNQGLKPGFVEVKIEATGVNIRVSSLLQSIFELYHSNDYVCLSRM